MSAPSSDVPSHPPDPLGLLGGTFDPVHRAHLHLARAALTQLELAAVRWLPAGQPWHRQASVTAAEHRLAMVRLATAGEPRFEVDESEIRLHSPGYTVDTLLRLRAELGPSRPLIWLMGADAFLALPTWHRWREILHLCHLAVAHRPGSPLDEAAMAPELADLWRQAAAGAPADDQSQPGGDGVATPAAVVLRSAPAGRIVSFTIEPVEPADLSATMLRARLADGATAALAPLLPAGVLDYIRLHRLYA